MAKVTDIMSCEALLLQQLPPLGSLIYLQHRKSQLLFLLSLFHMTLQSKLGSPTLSLWLREVLSG
jgi:hypothetical protein